MGSSVTWASRVANGQDWLGAGGLGLRHFQRSPPDARVRRSVPHMCDCALRRAAVTACGFVPQV